MNECNLRCGVPFGLPTFFLDFIGVRVSDSVVPFSVLLTFSMSVEYQEKVVNVWKRISFSKREKSARKSS
jgi:hypothetical protein